MAAITSATSGNWSATSTWNGGVVPVEGDTVTIASGHTVTIDQDVTVGSDPGGSPYAGTPAIDIQGTLTFNTVASRTLTLKGDLKINTNGTLTADFSSVPTNTLTIKFNYSASMSAGKYGFYTTSNLTNTINLKGASKTVKTTLSSNANSAQPTISVVDATGWLVGDTIFIGPTGTGNGTTNYQTDRMTIQSISGTGPYTITLTTNLPNSHLAGAVCYNITRNIRLIPYNTSYPYNTLTRILDSSKYTLTNVEIGWFGYNNVDFGGYGWNLNGCNAIITGCSFHSGSGSYGLRLTSQSTSNIGQKTTVTGTVFAANNVAVGINNSYSDSTIDSCYFIGNSNGISMSYSSGSISNTLKNCDFIANGNSISCAAGSNTMASNNTYYSNSSGWTFSAGVLADHKDTNSNFGIGPGGIQPNGSGDIYVSSSCYTTATFDGCNFYSPKFVIGQQNLKTGSYIAIAKKNNVVGDDRVYYPFGTLKHETTTIGGKTYYARLYPTSANNPVSIELGMVAIANDNEAFTCFAAMDSNYGSSNLPTFTISGAGATPMTQTMVAGTAEQQITLGATPTENGRLKITITAQGNTSGKLYLRGLKALSTTWDTGTLNFWDKGLPLSLIANNVTSPTDFWNVQTSQITAEGTFGSLEKRTGVYEKAILL